MKYLLLEKLIEEMASDKGIFQEALIEIRNELGKMIICHEDKIYEMLQEVLHRNIPSRKRNLSYYYITNLLG